jgi:tRNA1Val (adenine37-N6)-methyltransferase
LVTLTTTRDTLYAGSLTLEQPARGYRFNVDSLLLADFAGEKRATLCVDLGAGVGTVALALHHLGRARRVELVELDPDIAAIAGRNLALAGAPGDVHAHDVANGLPRALRQRADLVVSNPPFFDPAAHRPASDPRAQRARSGALEPFVSAAAQALAGPRARALFAYPARSLLQLFELATARGLEPKRLRLVHADRSSPARLALVELRRARPGGLVVEAPLYEWLERGRRSPELSLIIGGRTGGRT